jgi:hypothetical protein
LDKASNEQLKKFRDQQDKLTDSYSSQIQAADNASNSKLGEAKAAEVLANKLDELSQKENLNTSEKAQMKVIVDQLNNTLPNLNLQIDAQTGKIIGNTNAIYENIKALKSQAIAQAYQAKAQAAGTKYVEQEELLGQTQSQLDKERSEFYSMTYQYAGAISEISDLRAKAEAEGSSYEGIGRAVARINEKYGIANIEQQLSDRQNRISEYNALLEEQKAKLDEYSADIDKYTTKAVDNIADSSPKTIPSGTGSGGGVITSPAGFTDSSLRALLSANKISTSTYLTELRKVIKDNYSEFNGKSNAELNEMLNNFNLNFSVSMSSRWKQ